MPVKRRTPKEREFKITPQTVELFRRGVRLIRRPGGEDSREYRDISVELDRLLQLRPWQEPILDTVNFNAPPDWMSHEMELEDWHRSEDICRHLEAAVRAQDDAAREARRRSPPESPSEPSLPAA